MALIGIGPRPVEHEFAVGMRLDISGRKGHQLVTLVQPKVMRLPACIRADRSGSLQGIEESMGKKRIVRVIQLIPVPFIDLGKIRDDTGDCFHFPWL